ncbi:MAG: glycosyltransferase family 4 protein [Chloroflexi bacterium]|nr:glycosyltransferase family 4 protein [Chloroflexota bacterium]
MLHVLTRALGIGGDARMVWRWAQQDAGRQHSLVLTRQGPTPVPPPLRNAIAAAGGQVHVLNTQRGSLLAWARALREIAASADIVILHVHPYDVIPVLAFADKTASPPVVYADHADHAFWVGAGISDVVAGLRESGARLAQERRGVPPERSATLPIIMPPTERTLPRAQAKQQLGLPAESILLLSIARPHKYEPLGELDFLGTLLPVVEQHRQSRLLVIGPEQTGPWAQANAQTLGRVQALGKREDTALFYQAADIYVDSFPIVSITSLLEAGSYGTPLLSRCWPAAEGSILGADTQGLDRCLLRANDRAGYQAALARLISDTEHRTRAGKWTQEALKAVHHAPGWQRTLEALYQQAASLPPVTPLPESEERCLTDVVDLWLPHIFQAEPNLEQIIQFHLQLMPLRLRVANWIELRKANPALSPGLLLPEWLGVSASRLRLSR